MSPDSTVAWVAGHRMHPYDAWVVDPFLDALQESEAACVDSGEAAKATAEGCTCHRTHRIPMVAVQIVCYQMLLDCWSMASMVRSFGLVGQEQRAVACFHQKSRSGCWFLTVDMERALVLVEVRRGGIVPAGSCSCLPIPYRQETPKGRH